MDIEQIKQKMFDKLEPSGWGKVFKSFIFSSEFEKILNKLWDLSNKNSRFAPTLKQIFRAFEECPYDKLQVVIVGQDPYPTLNVADGIAFSCSNTNKLQPSLKFILQEVDKTIYDNHVISKDLDLKRWSNQGILLFNTALTVEIGKIGSHYDIWKPFTAYLFDYLNQNNSDLIYVYMGKKAQEWSDLTNDDNHKFFIKHPASAAYNGSKWDSDDIFNKISLILNNKDKTIITW
jgi:uracil-DNA glycosylase